MTTIRSRSVLIVHMDRAAQEANDAGIELQKSAVAEQRKNLRNQRKTLRKSGFLRGLGKVFKAVAMVAGVLLASAVTGGAALGVIALYAGAALAGGIGATAASKGAQKGELKQAQEDHNVQDSAALLQQEAEAFSSLWSNRFLSVWSSYDR
ncbi:MAG: hypothetical protein AAFZ18_11290 [Myxococcota bacterium]